MLKSLSIVVVCIGLASAPRLASAGAARGALPPSLTIDDELLRLKGAGVYEASMFNVDVFVAGLYLADPAASASQILDSDQMRCLALRFKRSVSRQKLVDVARRALSARGRGDASRLEQFLASLPDAADGDILTFTHRAGGLEVAHNGQAILRVPDDQLARDFFASWVGPEALDPDLGRALLGR